MGIKIIFGIAAVALLAFVVEVYLVGSGYIRLA